MKDEVSECDETKTAVKMVRRKKKIKSKHGQTHIDINICYMGRSGKIWDGSNAQEAWDPCLLRSI